MREEKSLKTVLGKLLVAAVLVGGTSSAHAWNNTATGPWASFNYGNWTVYQDAWGAQNDQSCQLYANNYGNFACYVNYTGGG